MGCEPTRWWYSGREAVLFGSSLRHAGGPNELDVVQYVLHIYMCTEEADLPPNKVFENVNEEPIYAF